MSTSTAPKTKKLYVIKFSNENYWNGFDEDKQLRNAKIFTSMRYCMEAAEKHIYNVNNRYQREEITYKIIRVELKECEEIIIR